MHGLAAAVAALVLYAVMAMPVAPSVPGYKTMSGELSLKSHYVYRALSELDLNRVKSSQSILSARKYGIPFDQLQTLCPNGGSDCAICHIALGTKSTNFISTSKSQEEASKFDKRGMIRIDLNMLDPSKIFDLTSDHMRKKMLTNKSRADIAHDLNAHYAQLFSACNKEVLVTGEIPSYAYELVPEAFSDTTGPFSAPLN